MEQILNRAEWLNAAGILRAARASLQADTSLCIATAMERAWRESGVSLVDFDYARAAMDRALNAPPAAALTSDDDPLNVPYWGRFYMYWHDAPGRSRDEVEAAFDRAADYAEQRAAVCSGTEGDIEAFDRKMSARAKGSAG